MTFTPLFWAALKPGYRPFDSLLGIFHQALVPNCRSNSISIIDTRTWKTKRWKLKFLPRELLTFPLANLIQEDD